MTAVTPADGHGAVLATSTDPLYADAALTVPVAGTLLVPAGATVTVHTAAPATLTLTDSSGAALGVLDAATTHTVEAAAGQSVDVALDVSGGSATYTIGPGGDWTGAVTIRKVDGTVHALTLTGFGTATIDGAPSLALLDRDESTRLLLIGGVWVSGAATGGQVGPRWPSTPTDFGLTAFTYPPNVSGGGGAALATPGTVYGAKLRLRRGGTITGITTHLTGGGTGLTAGQCFAAVYDGTKKLVGVTADQAAAWASPGTVTMPLAGGPKLVPAGYCYVVAWFNGTVGPALARAGSGAYVNGTLTGDGLLFFSADTGRTTTPPGPLGTLAAISEGYWFGLT